MDPRKEESSQSQGKLTRNLGVGEGEGGGGRHWKKAVESGLGEGMGPMTGSERMKQVTPSGTQN